MIIDTHCHYNLEPLFATEAGERQLWRQHWQNSKQNGVVASLVVGTNTNTSLRAITIAEADENLYASLGTHPGVMAEFEHRLLSIDWIDQKVADFDEITLAIINKNNPKVIAIGETGLDYYRLPEDERLKKATIYGQKQILMNHLNLAKERNLPVILHVRDKNTPEEKTADNAYWDALAIVSERLGDKHPFILHCVSGPLSYIQQATELNCYIGVAGNVTYSSADQIRAIVKSVPQDRILIETDAPYLPPQSNRGKICEPMMIKETSEYLENELGLSADQILANTKAIFPQLVPQS